MPEQLRDNTERLANLFESRVLTSFYAYREARRHYWYAHTFVLVLGGLGLILGLGLQWIFNDSLIPEDPIYLYILLFISIAGYLYALFRIRCKKIDLERYLFDLQRYGMTLSLKDSGNREVLCIESSGQNKARVLPVVRNVKTGALRLNWNKFDETFDRLLN